MESFITPGRLKLVSNRLPVSVKRGHDGDYQFTPSSGGLVSGLKGLSKGAPFKWYGWPGVEVPEEDQHALREELHEKHDVVPVFLEQKLAESYYDGFSNSTVWPLFHSQLDKVSFDDSSAKAYRTANEVFTSTLEADINDDDLVWIHDYHLMMVPGLLRERLRKKGIKAQIGWFLHTPFPSEDFFTVLPSKNEILEGILGSDVIGFHTDEHRRNFLYACSKILKLHSHGDKLKLHDGREVSVRTFPIGIDPSEFRKRLENEEVQKMASSMRQKFDGCKVVIGVDRLDYIKGVPQKLHALDEFFQQHPNQVGKVVLVQVAIPSRANLEENQKLSTQVNELIGKINGKCGDFNYVPIHFLYKSVAPDELTALYAVADICFVSSTRDGMNLVCYEFIACHEERPGIVVLSKFAGASATLKGCIIINPWDREQTADALYEAVSADETKAQKYQDEASVTVNEQTSFKWGLKFLRALDSHDDEPTDEKVQGGSES